MRASELKDFIYNPIWTSTVLQHFLSGAMASSASELKTELLYLFPLIFDDNAIKLLSSANKTSSFYSIFEAKKNSKSKLLLIDLNKKVSAFHKITNEALIALGNRVEISLGECIQISTTSKYSNIRESSMQKQCKAAFYWGMILAKEDYTTLLIKLGITEL